MKEEKKRKKKWEKRVFWPCGWGVEQEEKWKKKWGSQKERKGREKKKVRYGRGPWEVWGVWVGESEGMGGVGEEKEKEEEKSKIK